MNTYIFNNFDIHYSYSCSHKPDGCTTIFDVYHTFDEIFMDIPTTLYIYVKNGPCNHFEGVARGIIHRELLSVDNDLSPNEIYQNMLSNMNLSQQQRMLSGNTQGIPKSVNSIKNVKKNNNNNNNNKNHPELHGALSKINNKIWQLGIEWVDNDLKKKICRIGIMIN